MKAWQIFNSEQWVEDIETVRKKIVGTNGKILLYGRSGGAYLVHQYLMRYGAFVSKAFTQSTVVPRFNSELNIPLERFWDELGANDSSLQPMLRSVMEKNPQE